PGHAREFSLGYFPIQGSVALLLDLRRREIGRWRNEGLTRTPDTISLYSVTSSAHHEIEIPCLFRKLHSFLCKRIDEGICFHGRHPLVGDPACLSTYRPGDQQNHAPHQYHQSFLNIHSGDCLILIPREYFCKSDTRL